MTATEASRLLAWMVAHGHTVEDAQKLINFIAFGTEKSPELPKE